jgi:hypothetical protein
VRNSRRPVFASSEALQQVRPQGQHLYLSKADSTIYCTATVASPRTAADWYYIEIKFSVVAAGWPTVVEIYESRRWQVHNASQASFEAYYNGG